MSLTKENCYKTSICLTNTRIKSKTQGGRGRWAVYYIIPQSLVVMFTYSLAEQLWTLLLNSDWLVN